MRVDEEVTLQSLSQDVAEELFQLVDCNRQYLREWLPWLDSNRAVGDTQAFIRECAQRAKDGTGLVASICRHGEICGVAGFNWISPTNRACEIGYWIGESSQGRGLVTRSVNALIRNAFGDLGLNRISIPVAVGNMKSRAIPERLGFVQEGVRRDAEWLYDHYVDHVVYAQLRKDWAPEPEHSQPRRSARSGAL